MDKKTKNEMILAIVLACFLGVMFYKQVLPWIVPEKASKKKIKPVEMETLDKKFKKVEKKLKEKSLVISEPAEYMCSRDLFVPSEDFLSLFKKQDLPEQDREVLVGQKPIVLPSMEVKGIIVSSQRPQAIINDKIVAIGDEILGAKIVGINRKGVMLEFKGAFFEIKPMDSL